MKVKIYKCKNCGANLNSLKNQCDYCGSPFLLKKEKKKGIGYDFMKNTFNTGEHFENLAIGYQSGYITGKHNIAIGYNTILKK